MSSRLLQGLAVVALAMAAGCSVPPAIVIPEDMGCSEGKLICAGSCADVQTDSKHCGACGNACEQGLQCLFGKCVLECPKGQTACDNKSCHNLQTDPANCGQCGKACPPGQVCSDGMCSVKCAEGLTNCDGACAAIKVDPQNCGACGMKCPQGNKCVDGKCAADCLANQLECGGTCVDAQVDPQNCGACGNKCEPGFQCVAGKCELVCQNGLTKCDNSCVNTKSDTRHCGGCGMACKLGESCVDGACKVVCPMGRENCSGVCVNLKAEPANCGGCGMACKKTEECVDSKCTSICAMGQLSCNDVCVNPLSDPANCGMCGTACPQGQVCAMGKCQLVCMQPLLACANNQCVDPRFDPANCGACGMACKGVPNGTPGCSMGKCTVGACDKNFNNCDANDANGCESNQQSDKKNCGGCGRACAPTEDCCTGGCLNVMVDNNNCGGCGKVCAQGLKCCGGACLDPKFSQVPSLDCKKPFIINVTQNGEFGMTGKVDQLKPDDMGIITIPPEDKPPPAKSPFVWIAMHDSHQVNRVDAVKGDVLGTYSSRGQNPSRVAVALDNSVWVGNRGPNSPNDGNVSNVAQILPDGTAGCTIRTNTKGGPMPFLRALAIDGNGYVWAGTWNDATVHKIDPAQCKVIADIPMSANINGQNWTSYPYGLNADRNQILWNSNLGSGSAWMGLDVKAADPAKNVWKYAVRTAGCSYGVVIDPDNNVFLSNCSGSGLHRIDGKTQAYSAVGQGNPGGTVGLTIDSAGDVYQGGGGQVNKYARGTGAFIKSYKFPAFNNMSGSGQFNSMYGIAGDTYGNVWVTDYSSSSFTRFAPDGTVQLQRKLPGTTCYNYSDWNAIVLKTVTANNAQAGTWTRDYDSGSPNTSWATATWTAVTPPGTSVAVYFKAGTSQADFVNQKSCGPFYTQPVDLTACNFGPKRWLQVIVNLNTNDVAIRPRMTDLKVYYQQ